jgi:hypothetical protein
VLVVAQVFTDQELEALHQFLEIGREELFRFFTLTPADIAFIAPGRGRGPADRLGLGSGEDRRRVERYGASLLVRILGYSSTVRLRRSKDHGPDLRWSSIWPDLPQTPTTTANARRLPAGTRAGARLG